MLLLPFLDKHCPSQIFVLFNLGKKKLNETFAYLLTPLFSRMLVDTQVIYFRGVINVCILFFSRMLVEMQVIYFLGLINVNTYNFPKHFYFLRVSY